jgi:hypothetical protein
VYRIDPQGKGFVLYQAHQTEVRSLLVAGQALYAGTSTPNLKRPGSSTSRLPLPTNSAYAEPTASNA